MSEASRRKQVDIILVHGLFIGACAWRRVSELLPDEFGIHCPELPFTSLEDDAAVVRALVSASVEAGGAVLLVGHSYGGMVISKAGLSAARLAFLAALAPEPGETAADVAGPSVSELCNAAMTASTDGERLSLDADKSVAALYHLCSPEDAAQGIALHRSAPSSVFGEPVATPAWLARPATYIVSTEDRALKPRYQRLAAAKMTDSTDLRADHSAFFSAPAELASILPGLARACIA